MASRLRAALGYRALVTAAATVVIASCGLVADPDESPWPTAPPFVVSVETPDGAVGLAEVDAELQLYLTDGPGPPGKVTAVQDQPGVVTVHLFTVGGATGRATNSFVFGNAPRDAARVEVLVVGAIGVVRDGRFLVALPEKDLAPHLITWRFLAKDGAIVAEGTGLRQ